MVEPILLLTTETTSTASLPPPPSPLKITANVADSNGGDRHNGNAKSWHMKVATAIFYAVASLAIVVANKYVLTNYHFPSYVFVAIAQSVATVVIVHALKMMRLVSFPDPSMAMYSHVHPLPLLFAANCVFGLGSTKHLSIPMMTVLRRFSILMVMIGEHFMLGQRKGRMVQLSVAIMIVGSIIAAYDDLSFNLYGYSLVMLANFFTAANGVVTKKLLTTAAKSSSPTGLLYYNSLFALPIMMLAVLWQPDAHVYPVRAFQHWSNGWFLCGFLLSMVLGVVLNYSILMCTHYNSALTTSAVGCAKNVLSVYAGMLVSTDYVYSTWNFVGVTISVLGSVVYSIATFKA